MADMTLRAIRVPDHIWRAAQAKAQREGTNVSEEVRRFLARWAKR